MQKCANKNELSEIENYKAQINGIVTGDVKDIRTSSLEALEAKKQSLESSIQSSKIDIYSQTAGIFSKNIDGLEDVLTPKEVVNYHIAEYETIREPNPQKQMTVTEGEPICKVVNSQNWYVMTAIKTENAGKLQKGQKVKLRFTELPGIEADGTVYYISPEDSKAEKNVVLIKCEQYKDGVLSLRLTGVELVMDSYEGYRVPMSAIHNIDDEKYVMVRMDSKTVSRKCKILYTDVNDQTVIISKQFEDTRGMLKETDSIIIGEK